MTASFDARAISNVSAELQLKHHVDAYCTTPPHNADTHQTITPGIDISIHAYDEPIYNAKNNCNRFDHTSTVSGVDVSSTRFDINADAADNMLCTITYTYPMDVADTS